LVVWKNRTEMHGQHYIKNVGFEITALYACV